MVPLPSTKLLEAIPIETTVLPPGTCFPEQAGAREGTLQPCFVDTILLGTVTSNVCHSCNSYYTSASDCRLLFFCWLFTYNPTMQEMLNPVLDSVCSSTFLGTQFLAPPTFWHCPHVRGSTMPWKGIHKAPSYHSGSHGLHVIQMITNFTDDNLHQLVY